MGWKYCSTVLKFGFKEESNPQNLKFSTKENSKNKNKVEILHFVKTESIYFDFFF